MDILFVCTGNTCRSPLAQVLLELELEKQGITSVRVSSAGIAAAPGSPASAGSISVLENPGLLSRHQARQVTLEMLEEADLILTMTQGHGDVLKQRFPQVREKLYTLLGYAHGKDQDIPDPFGGDQIAYQQTHGEIKEAVINLVDKLRKG